MARGGYGTAAEQYVIERVNQLAGWSAVNANSLRANQPGFDVLTRHHSGRELRISVKSVSAGGKRHDYGIGRSFRTHPADVYAFVDLTGPRPWPVYLAGARTVEALALERHRQYQADRGRPAEATLPRLGIETATPVQAMTGLEICMREFRDDDEGYVRWLQEHPSGFVVNAYRRPSPNYLILHRAGCPHISARADESRRWTVDYIKICAANVEDLQSWAREAVGGTVTRCRTCAP